MQQTNSSQEIDRKLPRTAFPICRYMPPSEEPSIEPTTAADLYQNILLGTGTFFSIDVGKDLTISRDELYQIISENLVPAETEKFSLIDLDGADELILRLNENCTPEFTYEIMGCQDGRVLR